MVKALLHLPYSHLLRAVLANHKLFHFAILIAFITPPWPAWAYCPTRCRALCSISPGLCSLTSCTGIYVRLLFPPLCSPCGQPGHIVRLVALLVFLLLLSLPSAFLFFSWPPLPPPPPPSFCSLFFSFFFISLKVLAQSGFAQRGSTFIVLAQSGHLSPCRALLAWCHLCFAATPERCAAYAAGANYADACRGPPAQRLLAFSSLLQIACFLPLRSSWFLGIISVPCSYFSSYAVLSETLRPLTYIILSLPSFLLDDVGSVGAACGILSGPSS